MTDIFRKTNVSKYTNEDGKYNIRIIKRKERRSQTNRIICLKVAQKIIYLLALLCLLCITIYQIYGSFKRYLKEPTYTDILIVSQDEAEFPSMTFCPMTDGYKERALKVRSLSFIRTKRINQIVILNCGGR